LTPINRRNLAPGQTTQRPSNRCIRRNTHHNFHRNIRHNIRHNIHPPSQRLASRATHHSSIRSNMAGQEAVTQARSIQGNSRRAVAGEA
jgi:hypothetical protein